MTTELAPHYLVNDEGLCFYPLTFSTWNNEFNESQDPGVTARGADGWIDVDVRGVASSPTGGYQKSTWYVTTEPVSVFAFPQSPTKNTVRYRLKDESAASARFPLELTPEEYNDRRRIEDPDNDGDGLTYVMYRSVTEDVEREPRMVHVETMTPMPGDGDQNGSWGWDVERTAGLLYGSWYHHLLPGTLLGVKERLAAALTARYGKYEYFGGRSGFDIDSHGKFGVRMLLDFDVPVFRTSPRYGRTGQKLSGTEQIRERIPLNIEWSQGTKITAANKAEAVKVYEKVEADLFAWIDSHNLTVCSHCKGHGYTRTNGPAPR